MYNNKNILTKLIFNQIGFVFQTSNLVDLIESCCSPFNHISCTLGNIFNSVPYKCNITKNSVNCE